MARFIYDERGDYPVVRLEAAEGEHLSVETVAAWAAMRQAYALSEIADRLVGIDNAITALAHSDR